MSAAGAFNRFIALSAPASSAFAIVRSVDPLRHFLDRRGLDVDRHPFQFLQHRLQELPRLRRLGDVDDADIAENLGGRAEGGGGDGVEHLGDPGYRLHVLHC